MDLTSGGAADETSGAAHEKADAADERADAGRPTTVLLTEEAVTGPDLERILAIHPTRVEDPTHRYVVLVAAKDPSSGLSSVVDHVALGEVREAIAELRGGGEHGEPDGAGADAPEEILAATVASLRRHERDADGRVVEDAFPATVSEVQRTGADDVVVVTRPRIVEDTLHRDWASRLRDMLDVPVLHVYGGTTSTS